MCTRSGKRSATMVEHRRRQLREQRRRRTRTPPMTPRKPSSAARLRLRRVDEARRRVAHRRVGRERGTGIGRRDDEVDLVERGGHRLVGLDAQLLGDRRGVQVVHRLREQQPDRDLVGELARARRPARSPSSASSVARLPIIHCAARFGSVDGEVDLDHAGGRRSTSRADSCELFLDAGFERDAAERRDDRDRAAREVVRAEARFPTGARRQARRVAACRSRAHTSK